LSKKSLVLWKKGSRLVKSWADKIRGWTPEKKRER